MKIILIIILFLSCITPSIGQNEVKNSEPMVMLTELTVDFDLTEHWYWSNYLKNHKKKSIAKDSTIEEGYRLLYWGNYFSIVEIIKKDSLFEIEVDSVLWNENKLFRSFDTTNVDSRILILKRLCDTLISESKRKITYSYEISEDDRDNWAFEWKNEKSHYAIEGIEVTKEFADIIRAIMDLGTQSNYTIYDRNGGKFIN